VFNTIQLHEILMSELKLKNIIFLVVMTKKIHISPIIT